MSPDNPWLRVSAADYEGHMGHPSVSQLGFLSEQFRLQLEATGARRIAVLGCATGNGFDAVDPARVERLLGVDINPEYLALAEARHRSRFGARLALRCANLDDPQAAVAALAPGGYALINAALLFEYLDPARLLPVIAGALEPGGVLAVVLQLPSPTLPAVSATPFTGVRVLEPFLALRETAALEAEAAAAGLILCAHGETALPSGKRFALRSWCRAD